MIGLVLCVYSIFMEIVKGMYSSDEVKEVEVENDSLNNKRRRRKRRKRRYNGRISFFIVLLFNFIVHPISIYDCFIIMIRECSR